MGRIGPTAVGPRPAMNQAGRLFPKQSADCLGTPSYFRDLPGVNPCKSSRATGRAPQKRRRAGGSGDASHGGTMFPRAPPPAGRIAPTAVGPRPAMNLAGRMPWCYLRMKFANNGACRKVTTAMRLTGAPRSPVRPLRPPAGFWCPRERAAAFVLSWLPVSEGSFPVLAVRPCGPSDGVLVPP